MPVRKQRRPQGKRIGHTGVRWKTFWAWATIFSLIGIIIALTKILPHLINHGPLYGKSYRLVIRENGRPDLARVMEGQIKAHLRSKDMEITRGGAAISVAPSWSSVTADDQIVEASIEIDGRFAEPAIITKSELVADEKTAMKTLADRVCQRIEQTLSAH